MVKYMNFLSQKEKRFALIIAFVICIVSTIISLISGIISAAQVLIDFPIIMANGVGHVYDKSSFLTCSKIFLLLSILFSVFTFLSMFIFKKHKLLTTILSVVNIGIMIIFSIVLRAIIPQYGGYDNSIHIYDYDLFSTYISVVLSIAIPLLIASLIKLKLEKQQIINE